MKFIHDYILLNIKNLIGFTVNHLSQLITKNYQGNGTTGDIVKRI